MQSYQDERLMHEIAKQTEMNMEHLNVRDPSNNVHKYPLLRRKEIVIMRMTGERREFYREPIH